MPREIHRADGIELVGVLDKRLHAAVLNARDVQALADVLTSAGVPGDGYTVIGQGFDLTLTRQTGGAWLIQIKETG